ncbi:ABC transporter substrate-binding protein [Paenibacillus thalictri]|uniref:Sugar ABC transporter substrate-binding protein n=1 Tax=Paenibacillus thalictri TaxID=2527873 RepID=A0A4Q9DUH0_9BACL|nr:sugar ABC transporter substrate-binding protein [Paenibacillus thalictri]TBL80599.1 sugar ABC transporter substrate-binding protein [Paenibacillus thalictri]
MKKMLGLALASVMLVQLAACSSGTPSAEGGAKTEGAQASGASANKQVNLRYSWWGSDDRNKAILAAIDAYQKMNPNVKIEGEYGAFASYYQKLLAQLTGGTAPDIVSVDYKWVQDLIANGKPFVDMNTMKDKIDMSGIDMKFAAAQAGDGKYLLGLPIGVNAIGLLYNKKLLTDAGIQMNNEWDWDTLLEAGTKLHQADKNKYLMFLNNDHYIYLLKSQLKQKTGNNIVNDDFTLGFKKEDLVEVFTYFKKMLDNGVIPPFTEAVQYESVYADQIPNWLNGNYGIFPTSASKIPSIALASKFDIDVARYPIYKNPKNPGIITSPSMIITINSKSANIDESAKFINWLMNSKEAALILKDTNGVPAVAPMAKLLQEQKLIDSNIARMVEEALPFSGTPENSSSLNPEIDTILKDYVHRVGYGKLTPEQAADGLIQDVGSKLKELNKK